MGNAGSRLTARVLKNGAILGSAQAVNIACSVVRTKVIAMALGPVGVGFNTLLVNGSTLVSTATQLNLRDSAVRDLAQDQSDGDKTLKTKVVRMWALALGILGAVVMIALSPALSAAAYGGNPGHWHNFALMAPSVFFSAYAAGEFAVMQAYGRLKRIAHANMTAGIAATLIAVILIYTLGLQSIVVIINVYNLCVATAAMCLRQRVTCNVSVNLAGMWRLGSGFMKLGAAISLSVLLTSLMNYVLTAYINSRGGETDLGVYQSGFTMLNSYVGIIFASLAIEYYPRLTRYVRRQRIAGKLIVHELSTVLALTTTAGVMFVGASQLLIDLLYSSQFAGVEPFITIGIMGGLMRGVSLCFAYRILAGGDTKAFIVTEAISVTVGLTLSITAYDQWSYAGLGAAYSLWYLFYAALTVGVCRYRYGIRLPKSAYTDTAAGITLLAAAIAAYHAVGWWLTIAAVLPASVWYSWRMITKKTIDYGKTNGVGATDQ